MQGKNYDVFVSWGNCGIMIAQSAIQADGYRPAPLRGDYTEKPRLEKQMSYTRRFLLCARGIMIAQRKVQADGYRPADPIRALQRVEGPWIVAGQMPGAKRE